MWRKLPDFKEEKEAQNPVTSLAVTVFSVPRRGPEKGSMKVFWRVLGFQKFNRKWYRMCSPCLARPLRFCEILQESTNEDGRVESVNPVMRDVMALFSGVAIALPKGLSRTKNSTESKFATAKKKKKKKTLRQSQNATESAQKCLFCRRRGRKQYG